MNNNFTINITDSKWVNQQYTKFYNKHGYIPEMLDVYNATEVKDFSPTISTRSNGAMGSGTVLVIEKKYILDDLYANRDPRLYKDYAPTLRSERSGLLVCEEYLEGENK